MSLKDSHDFERVQAGIYEWVCKEEKEEEKLYSYTIILKSNYTKIKTQN